MEPVAGFMEKGKKNSQTICWRIEKHGFRQGSTAGQGKTWEVLRFGVGGVDSEARALL
jgi:hypothetical protein